MGRGAHCADRSSVRVVIRIAGMQFSRNSEGHSEPLTVLPKIAFGEYPYFEEFSKNFLRSRRMRSLRLMTARWLTPIL